MNYVKNMKSNIRNEAIGKGMIAGGVIGLLFCLMLMFLRLNIRFYIPVLVTMMWIIISVIIACLFNLRKLSALSRRIRSLEKISGSIENDDIHMLSKDTAMGNTWLVAASKNRYRFWTKDILQSITLDSQNPRAKQAVLQLQDKNGNIEKVIVTKSAELEEKIADWMYIPDNVNDLTLGQ